MRQDYVPRIAPSCTVSVALSFSFFETRRPIVPAMAGEYSVVLAAKVSMVERRG